MQHLREHYGAEVDVAVLCRIRDRECCCQLWRSIREQAPFRHGIEHGDFFSFPIDHGWAMSLEDHRLTPPNRDGHADSNLITDNDDFLQSWLFFCLLNVVVRTDRPLFNMSELVSVETASPKQSNFYIDTTRLEEKITVWYEWHESLFRSDPPKARLRVILAAAVLEYARQVVRANLDHSQGETPIIVHPTTSLAIMVLGETLSAVNTRMLQEMDRTTQGWEADALRGWGRPKYLTDEMKEDFCEYERYTLKNQIGPNAILLLATSRHYPGYRNHGETVPPCSKISCNFVKASHHPNGLMTEPATKHRKSKATKASDLYLPLCQCKPECDLVGPDMRSVYAILAERDAFPVFGIEPSGEHVSVSVKGWSDDKDGEFAAVSHVWSQGLGNPKSNKVQYVVLPRYQSSVTKKRLTRCYTVNASSRGSET